MQKQVNIDLSNAEEMICPECEHNFFDVAYRIFKISKLAPGNPSGQDLMVPQQVFRCLNKTCQHIIENTVPVG